LTLNVVIKVNNRKVLEGIADAVGAKDKFIDMTVAIDKLDKIGWDGVEKELLQRGFDPNAIIKIKDILEVKTLDALSPFFAQSEIGLKGIEELKQFHNYLDNSNLSNEVAFDIKLARGLNYYTGCIFEVESKDAKMGSIGGGGRYDDLTSGFGLKGMSGVGISLGAERIFDIMEELDKFPKENANLAKILFVAFDDVSHLFAFQAVTKLRQAGINADIYPEAAKMQKQMTYANRRGFHYVGIVGEAEREAGKIMLKNMVSGEQELVDAETIIKQLQ
jgi:histidyl-tRNA synthetase